MPKAMQMALLVVSYSWAKLFITPIPIGFMVLHLYIVNVGSKPTNSWEPPPCRYWYSPKNDHTGPWNV